MRVLLVEDDEAVSLYVEACLADDGHEVFTAASPETALAASDSGLVFDLLISDFNLGTTLDGADVVEALQKKQPQMAALMITGMPYNAKKRLANGRRVGILGKPFEGRDLLAAVDRATAESHD